MRIALGLSAALAGAAVAASAPTASAGPGQLVSCPPILECGRIVVPLDHDDPAAGRLSLVVSRLRPKPLAPSSGTLLFLTGGPGQAGIARDSAAVMVRLRALALNREVISVDLRGTGRSGALNCPALQTTAEPPGGLDAAVGECAQRLGSARADFDTGQVVEDLEVVRQHLGIDRWAIGGVSYGTYVATRYARAHPDRVERLLLDSLVPPEGISATGSESFAASARVVREACPPAACGDLAADVARLDVRLAAGRVPARIVRRDGTAAAGAVGGPGRPGLLYQALLVGDLSDAARAALPAAVRAALAGDGTLLGRIVGEGDESTEHHTYQSVAAQVASLCEDSDLPWSATTPLGARRAALAAAVAGSAGDSAPFSPQSVAAASPGSLCLGWPEAPGPTGAAGELPEVPTLVLAGGADARTPVENAYRLATRMPSAEVLVVPHVGHSVLTQGFGCVDNAVRRFFAGIPAGRRCSQVPVQAAPLPVPPPTFAAFRGRLGDRRPAQVAMSALRATLADLGPSMAFGRGSGSRIRATGLRGGTAHAKALDLGGLQVVSLVLDDFQYVPRIPVSGSLTVTSLGGMSVAEGRLAVATPFGRAQVRVGRSGVQVTVAGSRAVVRSTSLAFGATFEERR